MRAILLLLLLLPATGILGSCGEQPPGSPGPVPGRDGPRVARLLPGNACDILEYADRLELLALDPYSRDGRGREPVPGRFRGFHVLGRADVAVADRRQLLEALYRGVNAGPDHGVGCWEPRHGIRAVRGERTIDLVICFQCVDIKAYGARPRGTQGSERTRSSTSRDPEIVFDALLKKLGLPKAGAARR